MMDGHPSSRSLVERVLCQQTTLRSDWSKSQNHFPAQTMQRMGARQSLKHRPYHRIHLEHKIVRHNDLHREALAFCDVLPRVQSGKETESQSNLPRQVSTMSVISPMSLACLPVALLMSTMQKHAAKSIR